jgi:ribosomal protein S17E
MQGILISEKDFDKLSDQFENNNKVIKEFEKRESGFS